jgi:superfamily II DNA or RNA helicase
MFGFNAFFILSRLPDRAPFAPTGFKMAFAEFYHFAAKAFASQDRLDEAEELVEEGDFKDAEFVVNPPVKAGPGGKFRFSRIPYLSARFRDGSILCMDLLDAYHRFSAFKDDSGGSTYRFLYRFFRLIRVLLSSQSYAPRVSGRGQGIRVEWTAFAASPEIEAALADTAALFPGILGSPGSGSHGLIGPDPFSALLASVIGEWVRRLDFRPTGSSALRAFMRAFFSPSALGREMPYEGECAEAIRAWFAGLEAEPGPYPLRLTVNWRDRLPLTGREDDPKPFILRAAYIREGLDGAEEAIPMKAAASVLGEGAGNVIPMALSAYLPEFNRLRKRSSLRLGSDALFSFLEEARDILSRLHAEVVMDRRFMKSLDPRLVLVARRNGSRSLKTYLDLPDLIECRWMVKAGDRSMSLEEFKALAKKVRGRVGFKEAYVLMDPRKAAALLEQAERLPPIRAETILAEALGGDAAVFSAEARTLIDSLFREGEFPLPADFQGSLRPYQERGYRWILSNLRSGLGAILADDMGLGKTIQAIAAMLRLRQDGLLPDGILVVAPAALIINWQRELKRFAPCISVNVYRGRGRRIPARREGILTLTTYQTAVRDRKDMEGIRFSLIVADEAHLMKNASTGTSKAVKAILAPMRLALTGTPVENRLEDLRSLFDFIIPGYLGGKARFTHEYRTPIELHADEHAAARLRKVTGPFLLRRLKTDSSIIKDLPPKMTLDEFADLSAEQDLLYREVSARAMAAAACATDPGQRAGIILGLLTALKQICNHPRAYDGKGQARARDSGKAELLLSLLRGILEGDEKALVFSQYVGTLRVLAGLIHDVFGMDALLYHGGMETGERQKAVDAFQRDPSIRMMLVSLKAGGLGLNLTAASRAIHFDLWYNPAVEDQATDRIYRIGQERSVFVHRLICRGTFEEKITAMLREKRVMAELGVSQGESWITRMSDAELEALFRKEA